MGLIELGNKTHHMIDPLTIKPGMVIIDAGCSYGEFYEAWHKEFKTPAIFYCIEPGVEVGKVFKSKMLSNQNSTTFIPYALVGGPLNAVNFTEFIGPKGKYHQWGNIYSNHAKKMPSDVRVNNYKVNTINLSLLMGMYSITWIDYLKMDIEGAELDVIREMPVSIANKITQMSFEWHYKEVELYNEIKDELYALGFTYVKRKGAEVYAGKQ